MKYETNAVRSYYANTFFQRVEAGKNAPRRNEILSDFDRKYVEPSEYEYGGASIQTRTAEDAQDHLLCAWEAACIIENFNK